MRGGGNKIVIQRHKGMPAFFAAATGGCWAGRRRGQKGRRIRACENGRLDIFHLHHGGASGFVLRPVRAEDLAIQHGHGVAAQIEPGAVRELDGDRRGIGSANDFIGVDSITNRQNTLDPVLANGDNLTHNRRNNANILLSHRNLVPFGS